MAQQVLDTISGALTGMQNNDANAQATINDYLSSPSQQGSAQLSSPQTVMDGINTKLRDGRGFSNATEGLSLNKGVGLTLYNEGNVGYQNGSFQKDSSLYGPADASQLSFLSALNDDTKNNLIGSVPKVRDTAKPKVAGTDSQVTPEKSNGAAMQTAGMVGQTISDTMGAMENAAMNDYSGDLTYWKAQGKFWFDPNSDIKPDVEKYLDQMPSAVDALRGSGMNAIQKGKTDTFGEGAYNMLLNPAATKGTNPALIALNPLTPVFNAFDRKAGSGFSGYVGSQAAKGAMGGMSGGGIGAGVGAVVGVVKGIFTWFSAKGEDAKNAATAKAELERDLKTWTVQYNTRMAEKQKADFEKRQSAQKQYDVEQKADERESQSDKLKKSLETRTMMKSAIMSAGVAGKNYRNQRVAQKANRRY